MIRISHAVSTQEAQNLVDDLAERRIPLIWKSGELRRVLNPDLSIKDHILLLISSTNGKVKADDIFSWTGYKDKAYFNKILSQLHNKRLIEFYRQEQEIKILPPGSDYVTELLRKVGN